jgi:phosphate starvation-inducible protein PhoH
MTGDPSQHDRGFEENGFIDFVKRLQRYNSEAIEYIEFTEADVIRHPVVKEVLEVYTDR